MPRHRWLLSALSLTLFLALGIYLGWFIRHPIPIKLNSASVGADTVAISPDGNQVASLESLGERSDLVIHDAHSGRILGTVSLPVAASSQNRETVHTQPQVLYCDHGKYLLAPSGRTGIVVIRADTLQVVRTMAPFDERGAYPPPTLVCAANENIAALSVTQAHGITLFNLDTGLVTGRIFADDSIATYRGRSIAISPDGTRIAAIVEWWNADKDGIAIYDLRKHSVTSFLALAPYRDSGYNDILAPLRLASAGNNALVFGFGDGECGSNMERARCAPHGRSVHIWNFGTNGAIQVIAEGGREVYRSFGASADGKYVFAYTGKESICESCNNKVGKIKVSNARFVVWDRGAGKIVHRSPSLKVDRNSCSILFNLGSCTEYETPPVLEMSADGGSVLAYSLYGCQNAPADVRDCGTAWIYQTR